MSLASGNAPQPAAAACCPVVELRQYTLKPGTRDTMIALFDREFVETQEAVGMRIIGQFRDLDAPERFVWLRGFSGMAARRAALTAFYDGPVWAAHRDAARATMVDTDDALLLRPARPGGGFVLGAPRPAPGGEALPEGIVVGAVHHLGRPADGDVVELTEAALARALAAAGARLLASFVTDPSENTFPRLPVRAEEVYVWFAASPERARLSERLPALAAAVTLAAARPPQLLRLAPTARSQLRP